MSEPRVKKLNAERKKIRSINAKSYIETVTRHLQGPTFFDRLIIPLDRFLQKIPEISVTVIRFKVLKRGWKGDPFQFFPDVKEEIDRELLIIAQEVGLNFIYTISLTESIVKPLIKMGFRTHPNALYCIILALPETINEFLVSDSFSLDKFEFDKSRLRSFHKLQIRALGKYVRATWENQPVTMFKPVKSIAIQGHTDLVGSEAYNIALGEKRANEVRKMLVSEIGSSVRVVVDIVPKSYGEKYPFNITKKADAKNRRVGIVIIRYNNSLDDDLREIQESIRDELKKDTKIKGLDIADEIECIASRLTDLNYNDQFFQYVSIGEGFRESSLTYLRTELMREMYRYSTKGKSDKKNEKIYERLKFLIDLTKFDARKVARIHSKYAAGGGRGINRNDAIRMDFINDRICSKNPPSLLGCLKGFEKERIFINKKC